jgi:hypothetical protein
MAEVWAGMQAQVEELTGQAGLQKRHPGKRTHAPSGVSASAKIPQRVACVGESSRVMCISVDKPETKRGKRTIPIGAETVEVIERWNLWWVDLARRILSQDGHAIAKQRVTENGKTRLPGHFSDGA